MAVADLIRAAHCATNHLWPGFVADFHSQGWTLSGMAFADGEAALEVQTGTCRSAE